MSGAPPPPPEVRSVRHLGPAPAAATDEWILIGQDGGQSIDLGDEALFVFADTLLAYPSAFRAGWPEARWPIRRDQGRFLANCAGRAGHGRLLAELAELRYYTDRHGWPREILEATPAEHLARVRFWPEHGVAIDGRVYLYYLGIEHFAPGSTWGFRNTGTGLAVFDPATGAAERLRWNDDWRLWPPAADDAHGGVQVLREGRRVYVFGSLRQGQDVGARLARVDPGALGDPGAYEYLASFGPAWARDPARSADLGPCGHEFSVSFNAHLGRWLMCYVGGDGRSLFLRAADDLWGPYSEPRRVGALPLEERNRMAALAFEHSTYAEEGGRTISVSYCQPNFTRNGVLSLTLA